MPFRKPPPHLFIALLCVSVLFVRTAGLHLHLCLDGAEAPSQIHWADVGVHNDADHASQPHDDRDVEVGEIVGKTFKGFGDLHIALVAAVILLLVLPPSRERLSTRPSVAWSPARHYRPPLRGPPILPP